MLERGRLPAAGRFGSGAVPCVGAKLKSVSSLLSRNPRPGTTIPLPPVCSIVCVYDDDVAPPVGAPRVVGVRSRRCPASCPRWPPSRSCEPFRSPGATGLVSACVGSIRQARCWAKPIGQQRLLRDVDERRIADVPVAVGEGQPCRLEVVMQRLHAVHRGQVELLEDVQRLAHGVPPLDDGGHAVDVQPAVVDVRRVAVDRRGRRSDRASVIGPGIGVRVASGASGRLWTAATMSAPIGPP